MQSSIECDVYIGCLSWPRYIFRYRDIHIWACKITWFENNIYNRLLQNVDGKENAFISYVYAVQKHIEATIKYIKSRNQEKRFYIHPLNAARNSIVVFINLCVAQHLFRYHHGWIWWFYLIFLPIIWYHKLIELYALMTTKCT